MLELTEQRVFACDTSSLAAAVPAAVWQGSAAQVAQLPPFAPGVAFMGRGAQASWGLVPEVLVRLFEGPQGTTVEVRVGAQIDQSALVVGILLLLFFWPAAIVCGILANNDFQQKRAAVIQGIWTQIAAAASLTPHHA